MDMNWIGRDTRSRNPARRPIYNAADYDTRHGDPYYREHSTRADSLWRLYEESGTSITFDAFADESRQTDYRMETGALRDFFNGSQSALSSYRNPMGGNPLIAFGSIGRWDGERTGISSFETFDDLMNGDDSPFKDCEIDHIWDENGILIAAAFTGKTVSLCDQLEQATKQTAAEIEEMRLQEPSMGSSDGNDDPMAFFRDFFEGKRIACPSM